MKRGVAILGSTGSIGRQSLEVCRHLSSQWQIISLTGMTNIELLEKQAREFQPRVIVVGNRERGGILKERLQDLPVKVLIGNECLPEAVTLPQVDLVITAISGFAGLLPTIEALKEGKDLALANKETLVAAGPLVMELAEKHGSQIIPVDSEHSAIFQCLQGEEREDISRLILTASGGPFRGWDRERLGLVTPEQSLAHPRWHMGAKITVDSATLMNKGLEVIEARFLFGIDYDSIQVLVHPQSIIHSLVEFRDGSVLAQLGLPDMRIPIQYALTWPERRQAVCPDRLDLARIGQLTFELPDLENFPALALAYEAGRQGGTFPVVLNAANEVAVQLFLAGEIGFLQIAQLVEKTMGAHRSIPRPDLKAILEVDQETRRKAGEYAGKEVHVGGRR
ncbi:MAG TPA: 1-deoxy-D-xylulose-5-phosphate reductoisomerase [Clostridia bacterium]|nr:1-deoxy-D-xylulose-5-phosphate reductoisomerase [Clostridia bacterium]